MHTPTKSALIVIDAQQSFRHANYWSDSDLPAYLSKQQALIDGCVERGLALVQVLHADSEGPFSVLEHQRTIDGLRLAPSVTFRKSAHSALAGTGLAAWLTAQGIGHLIISGIRTEQCCETTTRHASDSGFAVTFVSEATLTFAMMHAGSGKVFSPEAIRERTELVLEGRFASIASVAGTLAALDHGVRAAA
jgi:nicotinamidase-related amidase